MNNVRRNAVDLLTQERLSLTKAIKGLKSKIVTSRGGIQISVYDQFVAIHLGITRRFRNGVAIGDGGHGAAAFLPWHREYIRRYEIALQTIDPNIALPYWDWTQHAAARELFQDDFLGPNGGIGGKGGGVVENGFFAAINGWTIRPELSIRFFGDSNQMGPELTRTLRNTDELPVLSDIRRALDEDDYRGFRPALEQAPLHNWGHVWVGGNMMAMTSPNDPIFFLHHCNVDRVWARWQEEHGNAYPTDSQIGNRPGHRQNDFMWPWDGGASTTESEVDQLLPAFDTADRIRVRDMLDLSNQPFSYDRYYP